ncbi:MAG: TIGR03905 family TSCPD domain-containing protein [Coriobacteriales bacterium]|jgi:uncharacterized protein (TIGR03905 family)
MSEEKPEYVFRNNGTCSVAVGFDLDDENKLHNVAFMGGCNGNLQGIGRLVEGMPADWVIERCKGVKCGYKPTSCPDQFANALEKALEQRQ